MGLPAPASENPMGDGHLHHPLLWRHGEEKMNEVHSMEMTEPEDELGYETWECDECPEKRRIRWNPWHIIRLLRGEDISETSHNGTRNPPQ